MAHDYDDDDDAYDHNGVLKDGRTARVSMQMRDAAMRDSALFDDSACRHQPGPVYFDRSAAKQAYLEAKQEMQDAWRTPSAPTDGRRMHKGTTYDPLGRVASEEHWEEEDARPTSDAAEGKRRKQAAYDAMVRDMCSAWKDPPPLLAGDIGGGQPRGQKPGDQCTINGAPGHLNARLECIADRQEDGMPRTMDAAEAKQIKDAAWTEMVRDLENAWRNPTP